MRVLERGVLVENCTKEERGVESKNCVTCAICDCVRNRSGYINGAQTARRRMESGRRSRRRIFRRGDVVVGVVEVQRRVVVVVVVVVVVFFSVIVVVFSTVVAAVILKLSLAVRLLSAKGEKTYYEIMCQPAALDMWNNCDARALRRCWLD